MLDGELFGVHAVGIRVFERRHSPVHGVLEGRSAGNTSANLVRQPPEIRFQRRRLECFGNQTLRDVGMRLTIG
jgi:hypothetical protein